MSSKEANASQTKKLLFTHPKCRIIHDCAEEFIQDDADSGECEGAATNGEYSEILKQQVREFLKIFQSEKTLMRQMRINEKRKEKL